MKAAYFERHGNPEVIRYGDLPDPEAGPGQIVVDIHAASVNGADWTVLAGRHSQITDVPYVLGRDFSGVVAALGDGVDEFAPGDPVFGVCDVGQEGTYAEKIAMKAALVARKPDSLSHVDVAALALIGLTAVVSIEDTLALQPGEKILIQGGGGVAGFGIQLAKHIGAHVIATCSARNIDGIQLAKHICARPRRRRGDRLQRAGFHGSGLGLRCRVRDRGRRREPTVLRRAQARGPRGVHRLWPDRARAPARRRDLAPPQGRA